MYRLFIVLYLLLTFSVSGQPRLMSFVSPAVRSIQLSSGESSCHASTVLEVADDELLVAYFAGEYERHPEVSIYLQQVVMRRGKWKVGKAIMIADGWVNDTLRYPCWNPVLVSIPDGRIALFYKVGPSPQEWWGMVCFSSDKGQTWGLPIRLPEGILGPIRCKPIWTEKRLLCGSSEERIDSNGNPRWSVHIEWADSSLTQWKRSEVDCDTFNAIQPTILAYPDSLVILCRTLNKCIAYSKSTDGGVSWSALQPYFLSSSKMVDLAVMNISMELSNTIQQERWRVPNNNSGIDALLWDSSIPIIAMNPIAETDYSKGRNKLALILGNAMIYLENQQSGEFSYPALIMAKNNTCLYMSYTYNRKTIKLLRIPLLP